MLHSKESPWMRCSEVHFFGFDARADIWFMVVFAILRNGALPLLR